MTIQIIEETKPETIFKAKAAGAVAGKVYPRGMTTNSANGVVRLRKNLPRPRCDGGVRDVGSLSWRVARS